MILFLISFIAGVLTVLAPCVLPLLPVIVGGSLAGGSRRRAYTICVALGGSVIVFTLLLKASTLFLNVPQSFWSWFSGGILILFGLVMLFPRLWDSLGFVNLMNRESNKALAVGYQRNSFWGDFIMGAALGPVFSSCSPTYFVILATVLPASFTVGLLDLLAYAIGLSGFLFIIAVVGQRFVDRLNITIDPQGWFRRGIGILFIIVGLAVATGTMARMEAWLLENGFDATRLELRFLGANNGSKLELPAPQTPTASSTPIPATAKTQVDKSLLYPKAPELVSPDGYINTGFKADGTPKPITIGEFKGKKIVLLDIWTYSCINCQRTLPYVKMWYDKYSGQGLEIISIHTPEFAFEHVYKNVLAAVQGFGIKYPVVLDNEYQTWNALGNQYWPRKYLIDIDGYIVYDHAGEGDYDVTEKAIQKALAERAERLGTSAPNGTLGAAPAGVVAIGDVRSPETYFGAARNQYLGNGTQGQTGAQSFTEPSTVETNTLYLIGKWDIAEEYAQTSAGVGGGDIGSDRIDYRYNSKNVYFVAGSATGAPIEVQVLLDSKTLDATSAGKDVYFKDGKSYVSVNGNRLYGIVAGTDSGEHLLEFIISQPGLQAYTFTFG